MELFSGGMSRSIGSYGSGGSSSNHARMRQSQEQLEQQKRFADALVELVSLSRCDNHKDKVERLLSSKLASTCSFVNTLSSTNEVCALHLAVWRNDREMVDLLLAHGADPDVKDGESGWTSLHRACYFGHLGIATRLLQAKASTKIEDRKGRTPFDLLSREIHPLLKDSGGGEVFSWGNGTNYQLGTGCLFEQTLPTPIKAESSHTAAEEFLSERERVTEVSAAKYHSCAVTASGQLLTWGFGRGGRLGHSDFHIHSGQVAVIEPRLVKALSGAQLKVRSVAAGKNHTMCLVEPFGDVYTWGSNKDGRLGYSAVDSQPTPRKVGSIKQRIVQIAVANKHSLAVTASGDLLTWGSNAKGQLGYGTTEAGFNCTPRIVEAMRSGSVKKASASKNHTLVLTNEAEVWTFGHKSITPKRLSFYSDNKVKKNVKQGKRIGYHNDHTAIFRPNMVEIAAGAAHSTAISSLGVLYCWNSFDPSLATFHVKLPDAACQVSATKERTLVCTRNGNVYAWEGSAKPESSQANYRRAVDVMRTPNIRRVSSIAVGEKHSLAIQRIWEPPLDLQQSSQQDDSETNLNLSDKEEEEGEDEESLEVLAKPKRGGRQVESLHQMCQFAVAHMCVNTRLLCPMIEYAEMYQADWLKAYCQKMAIGNLDVVAAVRGSLQKHISLEEIRALEKYLPKAIIVRYSHGITNLVLSEDHCNAACPQGSSSSTSTEIKRLYQRSTSSHSALTCSLSDKSQNILGTLFSPGEKLFSTGRIFFDENSVAEAEASVKAVRSLKKKLQQINHLEDKLDKGEVLDEQQFDKIALKASIQDTLVCLTGLSIDDVVDGKSPEVVAVSAGASPSIGSPPFPGSGGKKKKKKKKQKKQSTAAAYGEEDLGPVECTHQEQATSLQGESQCAQQYSPASFVTPSKKIPAPAEDDRDLILPATSRGFLSGYDYTFPSPDNHRVFPSLKDVMDGKEHEAREQPRANQGTPATTSKAKGKAKQKKGNLSLFLKGDLDGSRKKKDNAQINFSKSTWHLPKPTKNDRNGNVSSLKDIQMEQQGREKPSSSKGTWGSYSSNTNRVGSMSSYENTPQSSSKMSLLDFMTTDKGKKARSAWSFTDKGKEAAEAAERVDLRAIQQEQEDLYQAVVDSLQTASPAFNSPNPNINSMWFVPEKSPVESFNEILAAEERQRAAQAARERQKQAEKEEKEKQQQKEEEKKRRAKRKKAKAAAKKDQQQPKSSEKKKKKKERKKGKTKDQQQKNHNEGQQKGPPLTVCC